MLRLDFGLDDLAALRFGISPVAEAVSALRVLASADGSGPHRRWREALGSLEAGGPLGLLIDLVPGSGYCPDFLTPPSPVPVGRIEAELRAIRATPADVVRGELELTFAGGSMPPPVAALHADPATQLGELVEALARWHRIAIEPHWERLLAMLTAEVARQSRRLSDGGPALMLGNLHPSIRWRSGQIVVDMEWEARFRLDGRGLLLVPSAFWEGIGPIVFGSWQPTLLYPAAGVELMWESRPAAPASLAGVVGATRARILVELGEPVTTTRLARRLGLTAPGVSQHLQRLRDVGLVAAERDRREVRYRRTPLADELLRASGGDR